MLDTRHLARRHDGSTEEASHDVAIVAIRDLVGELISILGIPHGRKNMPAPCQHTRSRFVKTPGADRARWFTIRAWRIESGTPRPWSAGGGSPPCRAAARSPRSTPAGTP